MAACDNDFVKEELRRVMEEHLLSKGWWFFPSEPRTNVHGFLGTGKIFIVGDQPSKGRFEHNDSNRRLLYDLLSEMNAGDCHLTDLYKRRGAPSELKNGVDPLKHKDFPEHINVFHTELDLLRPSIILAMGKLAYDLIGKHTSGLRVERIWHFGAVWHGAITSDQFRACLQCALNKHLPES
jgi:uracil-DNA glycosylase